MKLYLNSDQKTIFIKSVKEFEVYNILKDIENTVNIVKST